ncbi:MAG: hypothetical protein IPM25_17600 [Chloracidobacterium sp.]|nr:hypothetical protein [Chloracidobacterium sp.]
MRTGEPVTSGVVNWLEDVEFYEPARGVAVGDSGMVLLTLDGGATWSPVKTNVSEGLYAVSFYDEKIGTAVGSRGLVLRTSDGGLS